MSNPFKKPKMPPPPPPPPPVPTIDTAARDEEFSRKIARRKGRAGLLSGPTGDRSAASVAARTLLGGT